MSSTGRGAGRASEGAAEGLVEAEAVKAGRVLFWDVLNLERGRSRRGVVAAADCSVQGSI